MKSFFFFASGTSTPFQLTSEDGLEALFEMRDKIVQTHREILPLSFVLNTDENGSVEPACSGIVQPDGTIRID